MWRLALLAPALYVPWTFYASSDAQHALFRVAVAASLPFTFGRAGRWVALWVSGIVLSTFVADDPWRAFWSTHSRNEGALQQLAYVGLLGALTTVKRESLTLWLLASALGAAAWGVFSFGWGIPGVWGPRLQGSTGSPLYLGALLLFGLWAAAERRQWWALTLVGLALAFTGARGALVGLVMGVCYWLFATRRRVLAVCLCIGLSALLLSMPVAGSLSTRAALWSTAIEGISEKPLLGWGAEGYPLVWDRWPRETATGEEWHDRAHSVPLDRLIEWGMVGCLGFAGVLVLAWRSGDHLSRAALVAYGVQSLVGIDALPSMVGLCSLLAYSLREPMTSGGPIAFGWSPPRTSSWK